MILSNLRLNRKGSQGVLSSKQFTLWITLIVSLCYGINCQGELQDIPLHQRWPVLRLHKLFSLFEFERAQLSGNL